MTFSLGIETLLSRRKSWIAGKRAGLVSHAAAVDAVGRTSAELMRSDSDVELSSLFGPEHGFQGVVGAGESCEHADHSEWGIPIHSLYGETKKPTPDMLDPLDVIVVDLQDIGARPYTYVSTLRYVLEAAAEAGTAVVVADRPIPLPGTTDGPVTDEKMESFVSLVSTPLSYGMTQGEMAIWLKNDLNMEIDLHVAEMRGYERDTQRGENWPVWVPSSPAIVSWETARIYPATVCFEALTAIHYGRGTDSPFQIIGSSWIQGEALAAAVAELALPGLGVCPHTYSYEDVEMSGIRMEVTEPQTFRPGLTAVSLLYCLQQLYGVDRVWKHAKCEFFDQLMGTDSVRQELLAGQDPRSIAASWQSGLRDFGETRERSLLYPQSASEKRDPQ
jgi:uncharacterized protein YbbC (DUF1343 family)